MGQDHKGESVRRRGYWAVKVPACPTKGGPDLCLSVNRRAQWFLTGDPDEAYCFPQERMAVQKAITYACMEKVETVVVPVTKQ